MTTDEATRRQALTAAHHAGVRHDRGDVFLRALNLGGIARDEAGNFDGDALAAEVRTVASLMPELCRDGAVAHQGPRRAPVPGDGTVYGGAPPVPVDVNVRAAELAAQMRQHIGIAAAPTPAAHGAGSPTSSPDAVEAQRLSMMRSLGLG